MYTQGYRATVGTPGPTVEYPWPVIRLAELYLNYAEACVGYGKEGYPEKGMAYLDKVRERARTQISTGKLGKCQSSFDKL